MKTIFNVTAAGGSTSQVVGLMIMSNQQSAADAIAYALALSGPGAVLQNVAKQPAVVDLTGLAVSSADITGTHGVALAPATVSVVGGTGPFSFTGYALPPGLQVGSNGQISGTPTAVGVYSCAVVVSDSVGNMGVATIQITIN